MQKYWTAYGDFDAGRKLEAGCSGREEMKFSFLIIILWYWLETLLFGTEQTLRRLDPATRHVVEETSDALVALWDYSAVKTQEVANTQERRLRRSWEVARVDMREAQTSAALAFSDMREGTTSATSHLLKAYHKALQRFR